ncbi:hypothetical protein EQP59_07280 [Ornithobacterium rhinotracheale]|uniref:DUF4268 domain-containing protein n=1 Tax=Ornithobacterium rhinotracheale TaxID=28251 RepID=A0A410JSN5_ORNRH|nr:hypothetical protein [Ornithobacterium rhinotracheale]QAR31148.1 hypothetical protein EQP59_07280 [Ornithobacterium rhinotracheale]
MWLEEFKDWIIVNYPILKEDIRQSPREIAKQSIVIDFENDFEIKRFTVWDDFSCVYESIIIETEKINVLKRQEFKSIEELKVIFDYFYNN